MTTPTNESNTTSNETTKPDQENKDDRRGKLKPDIDMPTDLTDEK